MKEQVVLVDIHDRPTGIMEKMEAHRQGILHRAVSVLIFNSRGDWLLQRRTAFKYHSAGLWSNACCTHPRPDEQPVAAARRRLKEEIGLNCSLSEIFCFTYRIPLGHGLTEHEYDHVFTGYTDDLPTINPAEVSDWRYISPEVLHQDEKIHPEKYTFWFRHIFHEFSQTNYSQ